MQKPTIDELRTLSVEDRLQLLEDVWATLDEEPGGAPMPKWHEEELDRRIQAYEDDPQAGWPWPEVKKRLLERA